ncbi:MAG: hypothetical protein DDT34_00963 [Firmicutes bacterium]|nr:hypothetical protein [Bacillota bacterium]MBT9157965.1 hypothetical protein [Bacillota bacterium]
MLYLLTALHIVVGIAFVGYFALQKKKTLLYLHVGLGALGIGMGMLIMMGLLVFWPLP